MGKGSLLARLTGTCEYIISHLNVLFYNICLPRDLKLDKKYFPKSKTIFLQVLPPELPAHPSLWPSLPPRLATHPGMNRIEDSGWTLFCLASKYSKYSALGQFWNCKLSSCLSVVKIGSTFLFQVKFEAHQHSIGGIIGNAYWQASYVTRYSRSISFCKLNIA